MLQDFPKMGDNRFKINDQYSSLPGNVINIQKHLPSQNSLWMSLWKEPAHLRKAAHINTLPYNMPDKEVEDDKLHNGQSNVVVFPTHIV